MFVLTKERMDYTTLYVKIRRRKKKKKKAITVLFLVVPSCINDCMSIAEKYKHFAYNI